MSQKRKTKKTEKKKPRTMSFKTVEEVTSHFFPESKPDTMTAKGKERGAKAAENAFTEIAQGLEA